jgi:two-component system, chemotaxis family, CheB/CheR fusion protein
VTKSLTNYHQSFDVAFMKKKQTDLNSNISNISPSENIKEDSQENNVLIPVVGIGASAGGVEALIDLLKSLPTDLGMGYVIIQHLSPEEKSILPQILQRHTSMPVQEVKDHMPILPDNVYVIPANSYISIEDHVLKLISRQRSKMNGHPIDFFFSELASEYKNKAIGVVLSGTATDGTLGLKAIKAEGGFSFAQDKSAIFHGMPQNATAAGHVDHVLPIDKIPQHLSGLVKSAFAGYSSEKALAESDQEIRKILNILLASHSVDFTQYKPTTIQRRILRRMFLNRFGRLHEYTRMLRENNNEVNALYQDLLINVTDFFRDPDLFQAVSRKILPAILNNRKSGETLRIWIPGCATGEEAYSFAISVLEFLGTQALTTPIQIFATDLDETAIEKARSGIYVKSALTNVSPQRLSRYFTKIDGSYQVVKALRDICIYAPHDLLKDPPFSRMDIISCQNLLIYVEANAQRRIMHAFHYALKSTGYLLLGKSETIGNATELFEQADKSLKIYTKKAVQSSPQFEFFQARKLHGKLPLGNQNGIEEIVEPDLEKEMDKLLLMRFVPASVIVNKDLEILRFRGATAHFFHPASGKASLNLLKMLKEELVYETRNLVVKAKKEKQSFKKDGLVTTINGQETLVSIEVVPVSTSGREPYYLVVFREHVANDTAPFDISEKPGKKTDARDRRIQALELELREARENIKSMTEEFEATREELQSANEEVLSSNEELQSINEELETSKEEMQSTNEELTTINEELLHRNDDLKEARDYAAAIVDTIKEPLVVLYSDLRVSTANKAFYDFFEVDPDATEGYYFYEIWNGEWKIPSLHRQLSEIFSGTKQFKNFELIQEFPGIGEKTLLINAISMTMPNQKENKILLAIEDITERRKAELELVKLNKLQGNILDSISDVFLAIDENWSFRYINKKAEQLFGVPVQAALGAKIWEIYPHYKDSLAESSFRRCIQTSESTDFEFYEPENQKWFYYRVYRSAEGLTVYATDITEFKLSQEIILQSQERYQAFITQSSEGIWRFELDKPMPLSLTPEKQVEFLYRHAYLDECNDAMAKMYGYTKAEEINRERLPRLLPSDETNRNYLMSFIHSGYNLSEALSVQHHADGKVNYFLNNLLGIVENDFLVRAWGTQRDVTEHKIAEEKLKSSEERFRLLIQNSYDIITIFSEDGTIKYQSPSIKQVLGYEPDERINNNIILEPLVHPEDKSIKEGMILESIARPGETIRAEFRLQHKDGSYRILEAVCVNLLSNPRIQGLVANYRDITERKRLEQQKEEFIGIASHELKTPVTSIKAYAQILQQHFMEAEDPSSAVLAEKMNNQIDRLTKLIIDLLDVTKISGGQLQFREEEFDLNELLNEVIDEIQHTTQKHVIVAELQGSPRIVGDRDRTGQVFTNLLSNAIKYSPEANKVIVTTNTDLKDQVSVCVQDFGIGMTEEMQRKVFQRFFRVNETRQNTYPGLGLGLYIASEIVKRQGGSIWVKSKKNEGSTFCFSLPLKK